MGFALTGMPLHLALPIDYPFRFLIILLFHDIQTFLMYAMCLCEVLESETRILTCVSTLRLRIDFI